MKKKFIFLSLMISLIIGSCIQQKRSQIEGTWKLVNFKGIAGDTVAYQFPGTNMGGSDIKMWSKNHFVFVGRFKNDTTFLDNYGGGTYKLEGNRYEENILYFPNQSTVGVTVKMLLEIRNDTLIQTYPVDNNGQINKSGYNVEKYIRLD